ncbi:MAG: C40 family peptidase [Paracoccaceae bacterium]
MSRDPRLTPARGDLAAAHLRGAVAAERYRDGTLRMVNVPVLDLVREPGAARLATQLRFGEVFTVYDSGGGYAWGQAEDDGYVGYVEAAALGEPVAATHTVGALLTHVYPEPDIKSRARGWLPFQAKLAVAGARSEFAELATGGFVPLAHVREMNAAPADFVAVAERFLGCPYLWGGTTAHGLDCSALVQLSLRAAGRDCPRDSDMQETSVGTPFGDNEEMRRGDLVFWRGHVGIMCDPATLLHANAHHMAVQKEVLEEAAARIAGAGGGEITCRRRP